MKHIILQAHKVILDEDLRILEVKAHQVRAVATSLAFRSATLDQVLEMEELGEPQYGSVVSQL